MHISGGLEPLKGPCQSLDVIGENHPKYGWKMLKITHIFLTQPTREYLRLAKTWDNMSLGKETKDVGTRPMSSESWLLSPEGTRCLPTLFSTRHLGKPNCHCLWSQGGTETSLTQTTSHLWSEPFFWDGNMDWSSRRHSDPSTPQRPAHGPAQTQTRKPVLQTVKGVHRTWDVCKNASVESCGSPWTVLAKP